MNAKLERRYSIGEVAEQLNIAPHLLRQWEAKFPQLKPKRDRAERRVYYARDIDIVKRINYLIRHEKMTIKGARIRLSQELYGEGRPKTNREVVDLLDRIDDEVRAMIDILDRED